MTIHRYPTSALAADYARASGGLLLTAGPLPWLADSTPALVILGGLAIVFALFGLSTLMRQLTAVTLNEDGVSTRGARNATVRWREIDKVDLRYFSTRRDREKGWMQLRLGSGKQSVSVDSTLDGFVEIAQAAARAATDRELDLSPPTEENFRAIGIEPPRKASAMDGI
ncbi:MAG: hypothetical protein ACK4QW_07185 [Alphaproteobacteria bacterium]